MTVRLIVTDLRKNYIHVITLDGIRDKENSFSLVHPTGYYTLNNIPEGAKLSLKEVSTKNSATSVKTAGTAREVRRRQYRSKIILYVCRNKAPAG